MELPTKRPEKIKLTEINPYLTCYLCKGYLIDATTISECLHSFCRSCIIKFLQENSFCPVCEVIINKAKPNLKLDKTLQDIVYKLVPELFLKEMTRRKQFYQQYPQIAVRVSPEERGEDTERTIFNPKDCISLSMEYVSDDSTPGAICLSGTKNGLDKSKNLTAEENQALMKRYLQCPGMCRVEVLKKFVRNKYNVDTNRFYIDILYKRVPLPDHYTLIDIAYIYSWKRNEPMTFYFRITDINKVSERFDFFNGSPVPEFVMKTPIRAPRASGDRGSSKRNTNKRLSRVNKQPSHENASECDKNKNEVKAERPSDKRVEVKTKCDTIVNNKRDNGEVTRKSPSVKATSTVVSVDSKSEKVTEVEQKGKRTEKPAVLTNSDSSKVAKAKDKVNILQDNVLLKPEITEQIKTKIQNEKSDIKNSVYTNITLNRTNNVEIITKIQKVSNKEGQPIGLNIIKQTVKKGGKTDSTSPAHKNAVKKVATEKKEPEPKKIEIPNKIESEKTSKDQSSSSNSLEEEKYRFFKSIELTAKNIVQSIATKQNEVNASSSGQKRKSSSPVKNDKAKKPKAEKKPTTKIIIQPKPPNQTKPGLPGQQRNSGLQSFIDSCKINIPSSLSITLKESSEGRPPPLVPPTKNYIEILKLDENDCAKNESVPKTEAVAKIESNSKLCDNDSEQKVDQDLSEIAKSLTEKIPMSTTVSQIVGPKSQFPIPIKNNASIKFNIQPSPVPELPCKVLNMPKENKLNPRSPQTFQKIFEESIKKPEEGAKGSPEKNTQKVLDLSNESTSTPSAKRNILEIASQLYKKTKLEQEKSTLTEIKVDEPNTPAPVPKVPIPRLPSQKSSKSRQKFASPKFEVADTIKYPQTLTNLHSNALGLNYTISVGQNIAPKINGVLSPIKKDSETKTEKPSKPLRHPVTSANSCATPKELPSASPRPSMKRSPCLNYGSPRNSPKHSPKSSPVVKHMYAPTPNLMDQLRIHTLNQKIPSPKLNNLSHKLSPNSSKLPSPSQKMPSPLPKTGSPSPKTSLPSSSAASVKTPQTGTSPKTSEASPSSSGSSKNPPKPSSGNQNSPLSPNQILEKYNIQNLAQLTASLNFNAANFGMTPNNQLAALQHAMLLKHFEMQNRQNWLNMNQGPLLQYEKYLQSLKNNQNQLLGNIKEN